MKLLRQGVCLAMLGAGLAASPVALASATTPAASTAAQAQSTDLVSQMRAEARGSVTASTLAATGGTNGVATTTTGKAAVALEGAAKNAAVRDALIDSLAK